MMLNNISYACWSFVNIFFGEISFNPFASFRIRLGYLVAVDFYFLIFWVLAPYQVHDLQIFLHSMGCLFAVLIVSFNALGGFLKMQILSNYMAQSLNFRFMAL